MSVATGRPTKRPRTRSVARREREEEPSLSSALVTVVQEGWLGAEDLGMLGQTSRDLKSQCDEELWKELCFRCWPNTSLFLKSYIDTHGGYSGWYRHRTHPVPAQPVRPPHLEDPYLRPNDILFLVDITRGGESLDSTVLKGADQTLLLEKGSIAWSLKKPTVLGKAACFKGDTCTCEPRCRFDLIDDDFDATMHLTRANGTMCCLYKATRHDPSYEWANDFEGYIYLGPGVPNAKIGLQFRSTPLAAEIQSRIQKAIAFDLRPCATIIEPEDKVALTGIEIEVFKQNPGEDYADEETFVSTEEAKKHGVTLLHILQELQGIEF